MNFTDNPLGLYCIFLHFYYKINNSKRAVTAWKIYSCIYARYILQ